MKTFLKNVLTDVSEGRMSVEEAALKLKAAPFEDVGFAKVDLHRKLRRGAAEVVYGEGKSAGQIAAIAEVFKEAGSQGAIMITRLRSETADEIKRVLRMTYYPQARMGVVGVVPPPDGIGKILVATGGTSDIPVAEEAAVTAEVLGNEVKRVYDVGVAGLHRLLAHAGDIMTASVIIAAAGMEGALASVIAGLADCPVIAVPTSVGYGASLHGISALLSMLSSCAAGVAAVNIDNGFGAGYLASMINHMEAK